MKLVHKKTVSYLLLLAIPLYWIASEVAYARSISPSGITSVSDFYRRYGMPAEVREFDRGGAKYFHLLGHDPRLPWILAFPSSRPAYVFDQSGKFIEWCSDPGDNQSFQKRWPRKDARLVDPSVFQQHFTK